MVGRRHLDRSAYLRGRARGTDQGFSLLEIVASLVILALIIPPFAEVLIATTFSAGDGRLAEAAVTLANSALDASRAVSPASSLLTMGSAVGTTPAGVDLSATLSPVEQPVTSTTLDNDVFTTTVIAGRCYLQSSGQCTTTSDSAPMVRVIAQVTWAAPSGCTNKTCYYVTSSLISTGSDPVIVTNPNAQPTPPFNVTASALGSKKVSVSWSAPYSPLPISRYTATASPGGQTCSTTGGALICTITVGSTGTYSFTVVAISAGGTSNPSSPAVTITVT